MCICFPAIYELNFIVEVALSSAVTPDCCRQRQNVCICGTVLVVLSWWIIYSAAFYLGGEVFFFILKFMFDLIDCS